MEKTYVKLDYLHKELKDSFGPVLRSSLDCFLAVRLPIERNWNLDKYMKGHIKLSKLLDYL